MNRSLARAHRADEADQAGAQQGRNTGLGERGDHAEEAVRAGKTLLVNRVVALNASSEERATFEGNFDSMTQGWGGTWDQLAAYLATLQA